MEPVSASAAAAEAGPGVACAILARGLGVEVSTPRGRVALLAGIDFAVAKGEFACIIGPSGCGKSTLLKVLAGVEPPTAGTLSLAGYHVHTLKRRFPLAIGYLPQFAAFHERLSVREILDFAADLRLPCSVAREVRQKWLAHLIELAGIGPVLDQPSHTLSGGQLRRVALAEELVGDPPFLFLDELTSGLDPHSEREMMLWLRELATNTGKTVVLVTHALNNVHLGDSVLFLSQGRLLYQGSYPSLLATYAVPDIESLYGQAGQGGLAAGFGAPPADQEPPAPQPLKTARPPGGGGQMPALLKRQWRLLRRDRGQLWLQLTLLLSFPVLVALFSYQGLPRVRSLSLGVEKNVVRTLTEQLLYLQESFHVAALVSGLAMFQVILLTLMGANNGSREIAKERAILDKERRVGLSPWAYTAGKFLQVAAFSLLQAAWMAWFVKSVCGFPGSLAVQTSVFFGATLAMSTTCLAISAYSASAERASLLAIYLVGLQLPLSGAVLALPAAVSAATRPVISAYWGWSGYLQSLQSFQAYDVVQQASHTPIAPLPTALAVLGLHVVAALAVTVGLVARRTGARQEE